MKKNYSSHRGSCGHLRGNGQRSNYGGRVLLWMRSWCWRCRRYNWRRDYWRRHRQQPAAILWAGALLSGARILRTSTG